MSNPSAISSGSLAVGTTVVSSRKTLLNSVSVVGGGVAAGSVVVYDNASAASGTILASLQTDAIGRTSSIVFVYPVRADNGLTVVVAGAGATAVVTFDA